MHFCDSISSIFMFCLCSLIISLFFFFFFYINDKYVGRISKYLIQNIPCIDAGFPWTWARNDMKAKEKRMNVPLNELFIEIANEHRATYHSPYIFYAFQFIVFILHHTPNKGCVEKHFSFTCVWFSCFHFGYSYLMSFIPVFIEIIHCVTDYLEIICWHML